MTDKNDEVVATDSIAYRNAVRSHEKVSALEEQLGKDKATDIANPDDAEIKPARAAKKKPEAKANAKTKAESPAPSSGGPEGTDLPGAESGK